MENKDLKSCYIMCFYFGERRKTCENYNNDKLYYVKKQVEVLQSTTHSLTKIIFNFNIEPEHYNYLSEACSLIPKSIQGAEVEINVRENVGISYKAWSDLFGKYREEYDYYIFNEDDYFFIEPYWDTYLIKKYNSYEDCGYLCMLVREPMDWNFWKKTAGHSVGISSSKILNQIYNKYGNLCYISPKTDYGHLELVQGDFGWRFIDIGYNIYDIRDDFGLMTRDSAPDWADHADVRKYHSWNSKYLCVSSWYWSPSLRWFTCYDDEYRKEYLPTSREEALYCYDKKLDYYKLKRNEKNRSI